MNYLRDIAAWVVVGFVLTTPALAAEPEQGLAAPVLHAIHHELSVVRPQLKMPTSKAVATLDHMLIEQYGARGHLAGEPDAALKPGYYEAATLLMNGYPVAGGTLVNALRQREAFGRSPSGPALAAFVDTMLQPTGEDDADLVAMQQQTQAALRHVAGLPPEQRIAAQVMLLGEIYHDPVASKAGHDVLDQTSPGAAAKAAIGAARQAIKAILVPEPEGL